MALKRLNEQRDPHLIRLLATYTYEGRFHLIFPWADGNLKDLWTTPFYQPFSRHRDAKLTQWMATQILGLACALEKIHYCPVENPNVQGLPSQVQETQHGRHGDLKPENILWFKDEENAYDNTWIGVLKIADFGFADFHSKHSRSKVRRSTVSGFTDTYKAPEYDVSQWISPQYDIWSFGCILLQFVVWYLRGWQGVDDFSRARSADSRGAPIQADIFFGLEGGNVTGFRARVKDSVSKVSAFVPILSIVLILDVQMIDSLKRDTACSDYILDLLEYVQNCLLRVDNLKRARIGDIVGKFKRLHRECQQSPDYCISRTKQASSSDSGLSEIVEVPNSPGKEYVADTPPMRAGTWPSHGLHSNFIGSQTRSGQSTKRQVGRSTGTAPEYSLPEADFAENNVVHVANNGHDLDSASETASAHDLRDSNTTTTMHGLGITDRIAITDNGEQQSLSMADKDTVNGDQSHIIHHVSEMPSEADTGNELRHAPRPRESSSTSPQAAEVTLHIRPPADDGSHGANVEPAPAFPENSSHLEESSHQARTVQTVNDRRSNTLVAKLKDYRKRSGKHVRKLVDKVFGPG